MYNFKQLRGTLSSLQQGIFPEDLKNATISPIYKNGDKSDCSNYRPISVLSNVAKILEKIVYNQLKGQCHGADWLKWAAHSPYDQQMVWAVLCVTQKF